MIRKYYIKTIVGSMKIITNGKCIQSAEIIDDKPKKYFKLDDRSIALEEEINNYLTGFSIKLTPKYILDGTEFQCKVWRAISLIPYGQTKTYGEIAKSIGRPGSFRAVANACGQNKLVFFIPCHRVVGKNNLGGYKHGWEIKRWLLDLEKNNSGKT